MYNPGPMKTRDEQGLERLVFFSDAVVAITLLVLELRLPEGEGSVAPVLVLGRRWIEKRSPA
ncbi:MAG: hypothetical protein ABUT39_29570 [Acidobacteriota bacterium]